MEPPTKILIVGEKGTGKSSIVSIFKEYESGGSSCTKSTEGGQGSSGFRNENANQRHKAKPSTGVQQDFSLKIIKIDGQKIRVQLWDQGSNMGASSTFQPLYIRNISGCIIVANSMNQKSIERA